MWEFYAVQIAFVILSITASYLLGSINSAIIVSKSLYKDDIRNHGSGNAGMTNMLRTYGKGAAGLTLLGDVLKTAVAIVFTAFLLGFRYNHGISLNDGYCYMAGLFAVLGHVFPIYYGFRGGKGVLVTAAMALILTPVPFAILITLFIIIVAISKYVSLGSVTVAILYPVIVNFYIRYVFEAPAPGILMLCLVILAIFIVWCHRENLVRISNKTERKISVGGKKKENNEE
jgi:glycerol-3-phosphate acyltransferase PlsY